MNGLRVLLLLFLALPATEISAGMLEEAAKISDSIQRQLSARVNDLLGTGKASVWVRVELALDSRIQKAVNKSFVEKSKAEAPSSDIKSAEPEPDAVPPNLPGFSSRKSAATSREVKVIVIQPEPTVSRPALEPELALAAGTFVKKISVLVSLDRGVSRKREDEIRAMIEESVLDPARGDELKMDRVDMPSVWERVLGNPGLVIGLIEWALLAAIGLAAAVFMGLLLIRGFKNEKIYPIPAESFESYGSGRLQPPGQAPALPAEDAGSAEPAVISIPMDHVGRLHYLLRQEPPENIAMVVPHLRADIRRAFLALLPAEKTVQVLASLEQVRFVEKTVVERLKDEIEMRIQSTVGGAEQIARIIEETENHYQSELLELLKLRKPDLYEDVRSRILLFGDLGTFSDRDWKILLSILPLQDLAEALSGIDEKPNKQMANVLIKIRTNLTPSERKTLDKELRRFQAKGTRYAEEAQEQVLARVKALMRNGKISNLLKERSRNSATPELSLPGRPDAG